ncbi:hypothetical protein N6L27_18600 [Leisingera sp. SS27]|uniref:hypothetical protein n=1 Tax=Leisingera sp. SS27 TaxID=2979462 RepID=UPI002330A829|nr:hypothetical protein [Leisingera sp. SS27]MDC0660017.1 hypothetical protein [Leisingera sp. SS27]
MAKTMSKSKSVSPEVCGSGFFKGFDQRSTDDKIDHFANHKKRAKAEGGFMKTPVHRRALLPASGSGLIANRRPKRRERLLRGRVWGRLRSSKQ